MPDFSFFTKSLPSSMSYAYPSYLSQPRGVCVRCVCLCLCHMRIHPIPHDRGVCVYVYVCMCVCVCQVGLQRMLCSKLSALEQRVTGHVSAVPLLEVWGVEWYWLRDAIVCVVVVWGYYGGRWCVVWCTVVWCGVVWCGEACHSPDRACTM